MLVFCGSCGKRISDRVAVCPFCGAVRSDGTLPGYAEASPPPTESLPQRRGTSPLVYVLLGCGAVAFFGVLAAGIGFYLLARQVDEAALEQQANPELRTAKATDVLHAERLPDGYYAVAALRSPLLDLVLLGDLPAQPSGKASGFRERGFIYRRVAGEPSQLNPIRSFVMGQTNNSSVLRAANVDLATNAIIRRGTLDLQGDSILYCVQRGEMTVKSAHVLGLQAISVVDCRDRQTRIAVWFGPDPSPGTPVAQFDVAGTVADEKELRAFLSHFRMCWR
jgi:hypothetical protein